MNAHTPVPAPRADAPRLDLDIDRVHELAAALLPVYAHINADTPLADPEQNSCLTELRGILHELHPADMAALLESLPPKERVLVWKLAEPEDDGAVLLEVSEAVRETLLEAMNREEMLAAVEDMDADELAELADDLVSVRADVSCEVVLRYLRRFDSLPDHTDKIFVVDEQDVLIGVLPIRKLLISNPEELVENVMATDVVRFSPEDDAEEAAQAFERYDLVTAPVIDASGKLIGRITVDEMVDVIREESEADILNMAGLQEEEDLFAPVWDSVKNRWTWLAVNLCTAFVASRVIGAFEGSIQKIVALAALMPIVAGIGGNSGNQTITMIVRAMAVGQLADIQAGRLLKKEVGVALANGLIWGSVMGVLSYALYGSIGIGLVMVAAMTLNLLLAAVVGVLIPIVMEKLGRDPALGSSVLITAVTDSGGFLIFLGLATVFLT